MKTRSTSHTTCLVLFLLCLFLLATTLDVKSQGIIPTKGKDFWVGFPYNPDFGGGTPRRCDVFITSDVATTGVISIPKQGWTQNFTVAANTTTTITLPIAQVEHTTSEVVENKAVNIISQDTISVFAISFQQYTADATVIYPKESLGAEYRISSYQGIPASGSPANLNSDFLIVSTEDGTQVLITPTATTLGNHAAGSTFQVNLDAGESYQVISQTSTADLTGTVIKATDSSGTCRPYAVFSGAACTRVPASCTACDVLYDQAIPVSNWGKIYYAVPFSFATSYTLRILADKNNTIYTVNGGAPVTLNAGQFTEINNITGTKCISANKPISVIQYMEGVSCANAGDPSMMYLNSQDQKIDDVRFSTVTSTIITQHNVNVIMETAHISQLKLDGVSVAASAFTTLTSCNTVSYADLTLTQGSHTLSADSGFTAYVYGTGSAESYAYSVGSFSKFQKEHVDSILCSGDTIHIGDPTKVFNCWWSTLTLPNDTIGNSAVLTLLPPIIPDVYILHGNEFISGCEKVYYFNVEVPNPPLTQVTSLSSIACQNQHVQLNASTIPASSVFQFAWTPAAGLNNPNIANPVLTATVSGWYKVAISSSTGCAITVYDSIYVSVQTLPLPPANAGSDQSICPGDTVNLSASPGYTYLWMPGGITTSSIQTIPTNTTNYILFITDSLGCQNSDTVKVVVKAAPNVHVSGNQSICLGTSTTINAIGIGPYLWSPGGSTSNSITVSPGVSTYYKLTVNGTNGCVKKDSALITVNSLPTAFAGQDQVICPGATATLTATGGLSYLWTPGNLTSAQVTVSPASAVVDYIVKVTDVHGCVDKDTVKVKVIKPAANFILPPALCEKTPLTFTNSSTIGAGAVSFFNWNFGDGGTASTSNPLHTYLTFGNYPVKLVVTSNAGCLDSITKFLTVFKVPQPDFVMRDTCVGKEVQFTDLSPLNFDTINQWMWHFGDSTTSVLENPTHSYLAAGNYNVQLTVTSNHGCKTSITKSNALVIHPLPQPQFTYTPQEISSLYPQVQFLDHSTGAVQWLWNFGDKKGTSVLPSPNYLYTDTGWFHVNLTLTSDFGCVDSSDGEVYIEPNYSIYFPNSFSPNGDGKNDEFGAQGENISAIDMYIFNRWGEIVYHSNELKKTWKGTMDNGSGACEVGVYVYKVTAADYKNRRKVYTGNVTLIR